jgi:Uncharacterized conserved protein
MNIVLSSKNLTKNNAINSYLESYSDFFGNHNIILLPINNDYTERPVNEEVYQAVKIRNELLKKECQNKQLNFDYLISIQTGYKQEFDRFYMLSYCSVENKEGKSYVGISSALEVSKLDFEFFTSKIPLKQLITELDNTFIGFITNDKIKREDINMEALRNAFVNFVNTDKRKKLDKITKKIIKKV